MVTTVMTLLLVRVLLKWMARVVWERVKGVQYRPQSERWEPWIAWTPVKLEGTWFWLNCMERRRESAFESPYGRAGWLYRVL